MQTTTPIPKQTTPLTVAPTYVITEEHLDMAIEKRNEPGFDALTDCLLCQTLQCAGFRTSWCGYESIDLNGKTYRVKNTKNLIFAFVWSEYTEVRACLPFVVELEPKP